VSVDAAVAVWIVVPIALIHLALRRHRALLLFQLFVDVAIVALPGRVLLIGAHLGPGAPGAEPWGGPRLVAGSPEQGDLPLQFEVWWSEVNRLVAGGEPPWISDRIGGGAPLYANGQTGVPFPLQLPVWVLGPVRGSDVMAVWKLELAALGGFLLLGRLGTRPAAAAVGALAYASGLYSLSWLVVPLAWVVAATPWSFWLLLGALRGRRRDAAGLGLLLGVLAGWSVHPESATFLWLAVAGGGVLLARGRWRRVRRLIVPLACSLAVAGVGAVPTLAAVHDSSKYAALAATPSYPEAWVTWPLRGRMMALAVVPWRDGHPADGTWPWPFANAAVAISVGAAALALAGAAWPRRRHARLAGVLTAMAVLAACLIWRLPGAADALARFPVLGLLSWSRAGFLLGFALAVLAGLATDAWLRHPHRMRLAAVSLAVQAVVLALALTAPSRGPASRIWAAAWVPAGVAALAGPGAVAGGWPLAVLVLAESLLQGRGLLPASTSAPATTIAERLGTEARREPGRVIGLDGALPPNLAARSGFADLRDNDPMRPRALTELHGLLGSAGSDLPAPVTTPWSRLLGSWGVRWLLVPPGASPAATQAGWRAVYEGGDGALLENPHWLPVVRVVSGTAVVPSRLTGRELEGVDFAGRATSTIALPGGGRGTLVLMERRPWRIRARIQAEGDVVAVLHVPRAPGWRAWRDGTPVAIHTVDVAAMAVSVPQGTHDVRWEYRPPGLFAGAALTLAGLIGCALIAVRRRRTS
jgi:hypothetical protein